MAQQVGIIGSQPGQMAIAGQVITNAHIVSQPNVVRQVIHQSRPVVSSPAAPPQVVQNRQQNLHNIQELESSLQEAKRLEVLFQQQECQVPQIVQNIIPQGHVQHHAQPTGIQVIRQPLGPNTMAANQLQQQRQLAQQRLMHQQQQQQQQQHHQQQQQQQQPQQILVNQQTRQMNINVSPGGTQALRNILQQQSQPGVMTRTIGLPQTQTGGLGQVRSVRPIMQAQQIHPQQHLQHQQQQQALLQQQQQQVLLHQQQQQQQQALLQQQQQQQQPGVQQWNMNMN